MVTTTVIQEIQTLIVLLDHDFRDLIDLIIAHSCYRKQAPACPEINLNNSLPTLVIAFH